MNKLAEIIFADAQKVCAKIEAEDLDKKTILITGASGLIGVYFLACLRDLVLNQKVSIDVHAVIQSEPLPYLSELFAYPGATFHRGDMTDAAFCASLPEADYIIHAASYGQPGRFMENPVKTLQLNTASTFLLFDKLKSGGKFLFISTSEVYSGLPNPPYREDQIGLTNTTHERSCYIEAKRCGEAICNAYRSRGVQAKSARLCLAYGPGTKPHDARVINTFIYKALQGNIDLMDQGTAKRTYCYVADAVEILWHILLKGNDAIYNVGGMSKTTIAELANKIGEYTGVPVVFPEDSKKTLTGAPDDVCLNMEKAKNEFGKSEYVSLDEGLKNTIEWQKVLYAQSIQST